MLVHAKPTGGFITVPTQFVGQITQNITILHVFSNSFNVFKEKGMLFIQKGFVRSCFWCSFVILSLLRAIGTPWAAYLLRPTPAKRAQG